MSTKLLHLTKPGLVEEYTWDLPNMAADQILVKTKMTGVCRSDIGNYGGLEAMPYSSKENPNGIIGTWGHEGLGTVVAIGRNIFDVKVGDFVATFSDPAYSDYYLAKFKEYVKVPELSPKYILQPCACGINVFLETRRFMQYMKYQNETILLIGSGFLSTIIGKTSKAMIQSEPYSFSDIEVVGNANKEVWDSMGFKRYDNINQVNKKYKVIIDLSSKPENFEKIIELSDVEALVCYAATPTKPITTNFFDSCWKGMTYILPSPRNKHFIDAMEMGRIMIETNKLNVDSMWTKGYNRDTEFKQAFNDGLNRPAGYSRGYIEWNNNG